MEYILEAVILEGGADEDIEFVLLDNILINRDEEGRGPPFDLENLSDEEVVKNFRFQRGHLQRIKNVFVIPDEIVTEAGDRVNGFKALCIVLKRLDNPSRLIDLKTFFNMSAQSLSQVIRTTVNIMIVQKGDLLMDLSLLQWLDRQNIEAYAQAIHAKGAAIYNCWGFIDGTARVMCRPSINQEEYYSGHKKFHCLKYQSVLCPDGIIISLMGRFPGRRHDAGIFRESKLYQQLKEKAVFGKNDKFVLFADQGYGLMELLITPFPGQPNLLRHQQLQFNNSMKTLRVAVEWVFSKIILQFAFVDLKKNQKLLILDLQSLYKVSVLLTNAHTCLYGGQTADYFNPQPPNVEEYFG